MSATIYAIMRRASFAISGTLIILAIILFIKLRIKSVIDELSGRKSRLQVAEFRKENSGNKSRGYIPGIFKEGSSRGNNLTERMIKTTSSLTSEGIIPEPNIPEDAGTVLLTPEVPIAGVEEGTTLLTQDEGTTLLTEEEGTTLLTEEKVTNENNIPISCNVIREVILAEAKDYIKVD